MTGERLRGRRAVITGATSGMGAAIARRLARDGVRVALLGRRRDRLANIVGDLGPEHMGVHCDTSELASIESAVDAAAEHLGGLDVVVTNAGGVIMGSIAGGDPTNWKQYADVNLTGVLATVHAGLRHFGDGPGDVVLIGSVGSHQPNAHTALYAATKAGVRVAAEGLRQELAPRGVRVTLVEPGRVDTEVSQHVVAEPGAVRGSMGTAFTALRSSDIADFVSYAVGLEANVCVGHAVIRPVGQISP